MTFIREGDSQVNHPVKRGPHPGEPARPRKKNAYPEADGLSHNTTCVSFNRNPLICNSGQNDDSRPLYWGISGA